MHVHVYVYFAYFQHKHPYVSAMVNNGTLHYDHDRDGTHTEIAGCEAKFRNFQHDTHVVIRYTGDVLTVSTVSLTTISVLFSSHTFCKLSREIVLGKC